MWHDGSAFCTIVLPKCLYRKESMSNIEAFSSMRLLPLVVQWFSALISWILDIILKTVHFRTCETKNNYKNGTKNVSYEVFLFFEYTFVFYDVKNVSVDT